MSRICPWWFAYSFDNPLRRCFHDPRTILGPYVKRGMTAADLGCGLGFFSLSLAELVGEQGQVVAVDVQEAMLTRLMKRAVKHGLSDRITPHLSLPQSLALKTEIDFALAFWMLHETDDPKKIVSEVFTLLSDHGMLFLCEPKIHVTNKAFVREIGLCRDAGFQLQANPAVALSHAALFAK